MLTFDEATHTYRWNGDVVPNVTRVIAPLTDYSRIPPDTLARAQAEGIAVHKMVELHCRGTLKEVPDWMRGHLAAWEKFLAESGMDVWLSEHRVYHPAMRYAGTLDLYGEVKKLKAFTGPALLDVKRSFYGGPAIGLQTAAYDTALATDKAITRARHRAALQLRPDGTYRLKKFDDKMDHAVFAAMLTTQRWKEKNYASR